MSETTLESALRAAATELQQAGIEGAETDARRLMAHVLGLDAAGLILRLKEPLTPDLLADFDKVLKERLERKPVSHITGQREFWNRSFAVGPPVLDPRPETETLVEKALEQPFRRVLDLGTGSGCILLTLLAERDGTTGMGVDISPEALDYAVRNRAALGLEKRAIFAQSDWFERVVGKFDLVVANPPYISIGEMPTLAPEVLRWEPMHALTPGPTGLEAYQLIAAGLAPFLEDGARILLEIGPTQGDDVAAIFTAAGFELVAIHDDMDGRNRVVEVKFPVVE
ncbi:MAG: peptide chain release factor N(5)-glutamine methyltransferase [Paracoccaceae bacterium]|nr:peptide chain release factor N(5)-glutamine methyltransferase [Paracoccaceae bacterium]